MLERREEVRELRPGLGAVATTFRREAVASRIRGIEKMMDGPPAGPGERVVFAGAVLKGEDADGFLDAWHEVQAPYTRWTRSFNGIANKVKFVVAGGLGSALIGLGIAHPDSALALTGLSLFLFQDAPVALLRTLRQQLPRRADAGEIARHLRAVEADPSTWGYLSWNQELTEQLVETIWAKGAVTPGTAGRQDVYEIANGMVRLSLKTREPRRKVGIGGAISNGEDGHGYSPVHAMGDVAVFTDPRDALTTVAFMVRFSLKRPSLPVQAAERETAPLLSPAFAPVPVPVPVPVR